MSDLGTDALAGLDMNTAPTPPRRGGPATAGHPSLIDDETASRYYAEFDAAPAAERAARLEALEQWADARISQQREDQYQQEERMYLDMPGWWKDEGDDPVPDESKMAVANRRFIAWQYGTTPTDVRDTYQSVRDKWTFDHFGKTGLSEPQTYELIQKSVQSRKALVDNIGKIGGDVTLALYNQLATGQPVDVPRLVQNFKDANADKIKDLPNGWEKVLLETAAEQHQKKYDVLRDHAATMRTLRDHLVSVTGRMVKGAEPPDVTNDKDVQGMVDSLAAIPEEARHELYASLLSAAETAGMDEKGFWQMAGESWPRAVNLFRNTPNTFNELHAANNLQALRNTTLKSVALNENGMVVPYAEGAMSGKALIPLSDDERKKLTTDTETQLKRATIVSELKDIADNRFDPVRATTKNGMLRVGQGLFLGGPQALAYSAAAMVPYAGPYLVATSIFSNTYQGLRRDGLSPGQAAMIAAPSAALETASEMLEAKMLFGKSKTFESIMLRIANPARTGRLARAGARFAGGLVWENAMEGGQDVLTPTIQDIAHALDQTIPDIDWITQLDQWWDQRIDTLGATLMPILAGGLVVQLSEGRLYKDAALRRELYLSTGATQKDIEYFENAPTPEERDARYREFFAAATDETRARAKAHIRGRIEESAKVAQASSIPQIVTTTDPTTGEKRYSLRDGQNNERFSTSNYDTALSALNYYLQESGKGGVPEAVPQLLQAEDGTYSIRRNGVVTHTNLDEEAATKQLADAAIRNSDIFLHTQIALIEHLSSAAKASGQASDFSLEDQNVIDQLANMTPEQLAGRIADWEKETGQKADGLTFSTMGLNTVEKVREDLYRSVSKILRADRPEAITAVVEEHAEGHYKTAIRTGRITEDTAIQWLRDYEGKTGDSILREGFDNLTPEERSRAITEAMSSMSVSHFLGNADKSALAPRFLAFLEAMAEYLRAAFARAAVIKKAIAKGQIGQDFQTYLAQSVGFDVDGAVASKATEAQKDMLGVQGTTASLAPKASEWFRKNTKPEATMTGTNAWLTPDGQWINVREHAEAIPPGLGYMEMYSSGYARVMHLRAPVWTEGLYVESTRLTNAQRREAKNTAIERNAELKLRTEPPGPQDIDPAFALNRTTASIAPSNLAPNGQPSNLTPELLKLVQSPEFKRWGGNWEALAQQFHQQKLGEGAVAALLKKKSGQTIAMHRPGLGAITFLYGTPGKLNKQKRLVGGEGLSHLIEQRNLEGNDGLAVAKMMPSVIAHGKVVERQAPGTTGERVKIVHQNHTAILSRYRHGQESSWLLTGWENEEGGAGVNPATAYAPAPSGISGQVGASEEIDALNAHLVNPDSVTVQLDENGQPKVFWHGTHSGPFETFRKGPDGLIHLGTRGQAEARLSNIEAIAAGTPDAPKKSQRWIVPVFVRAKPKRVNDAGTTDEWKALADSDPAESFVYSNWEEIDDEAFLDLNPEDGDAAPDSIAVRRSSDIKRADGTNTTFSESDNTTLSIAPFYSQLERVLEAKMPNAATPAQVRAIIDPSKGSGIKPEEIKWTGIDDAIRDLTKDGKVSKGALVEWLRTNGQVKFEEVTLGNLGDKFTVEERPGQIQWGDFVVLGPARNEISAHKTRAEAEEAAATMQEGYDSHGGGMQTAARFGNYTLPGGSNYREVVLAMPHTTKPQFVIAYKDGGGQLGGMTFDTLEQAEAEIADTFPNRTDLEVQSFYREEPVSDYTSTHFPNVPNYVAHMRLNEREDAEGKPGMFIEELQSDRHQQGREKGYSDGNPQTPFSVVDKGNNSFAVVDARGVEIIAAGTREYAESRARDFERNGVPTYLDSARSGGIPDAPFRKDWPLQMFKRALRDAVASGKEWIGWTTGETQADRYDLSKQVSKIETYKKAPETVNFVVRDLNGKIIMEENSMPMDKVADTIGKEMAEKIANQPIEEKIDYAGNDLKVGGEGMKGFYDNMLPKEVGKYVKRWGAKVEQSQIATKPIETQDVPRNPEGGPAFVRFEADGPRVLGVLPDGRRIRVSRTVGAIGPQVAAQQAEEFNSKLAYQNSPIWRVDITDAMREGVEQGQATFSIAPAQFADLEAAMAKLDADPAFRRERVAATLKRMKAIKQQFESNPEPLGQIEAIAQMEAVIGMLPPEARGKIGGFRTLASYKTPKGRLEYIKKRIERVDKVMEDYLREEFDKEADKLLLRAQPKREAGKKPKGKLGPTVHKFFDELREAKTMTDAQAEARIGALEAEIASGELTPEEEAHKQLLVAAIPLWSNWLNADAATRADAVNFGKTILRKAYRSERERAIKVQERRAADRDNLKKDTGKHGTKAEREAMKATGISASLKNWAMNLLNFDQLLHVVFGHKSEVATRLSNMQRDADNALADEKHRISDAFDAMLRSLVGSGSAARNLAYQMAQKTETIAGISFSQNELIAISLMWRQEKGKAHMLGKLDNEGNPDGKWHYDQDFVDEARRKMTPEASAIEDYLLKRYDEEYDPINAVFRELNGIDLPKEQFYSPIVVSPVAQANDTAIDPTTGTPLAPGSTTPKALRSRGAAVAEPQFRDAVQTYFAHTAQMAHWKAYAALSREFSALLGHRDTRNAVEAKAGAQAATVLGMWMRYFSEGGTRDASLQLAINQQISRWTNNFASLTLFGRISTLVIQSTQLLAASAHMPTASYISRFARLMTGQLGWKAALDSPYIQRRLKEFHPSVQVAIQGLRSDKPRKIKEATRLLGKLMSGLDGLFTAGTFAIVHDYELAQAKKNGMSEQDAEQHASTEAERITDNLAQPMRPGARSIYELTATHPSTRLLWAFASEARKNLGIMAYAAINRGDWRFARAAMFVIVANGILGNVIRTMIRDAKDPEDDELFDEKHWQDWRKWAAVALTDYTYGVPVIGEAWEGLVKSVLGIYSPGSTPLNMAPLVPATKRVPEHIEDALAGDADWVQIAKDVNAILSVAGMFHPDIAAAASASLLVKDATEITTGLKGE